MASQWELFKETLFLRTFGFMKIPMLWWLQPKIIKLDQDCCEILIPLNRKTKNHLNSMYFGVLCAGADCAGGFMAMKIIQSEAKDVRLAFKDFTAEFIKRAEGDTVFVFKDVAAVRALVQRARLTGERVEMPLLIEAKVPSMSGDEPVAKFKLTLSLKKKA